MAVVVCGALLQACGAVRAYSLRNEMRVAMLGVDSTSALRVMAVLRLDMNGQRFQTQGMLATFAADGRMLEALTRTWTAT